MTLPTTITDVIIDGNVVMSGMATDNSSLFNYLYDENVSTSADCLITNNYFSSVTSNASTTVMMNLASCSCEIRNNRFVRDGSFILAYINITGTNDQVITDNVFDQIVNNGTDDVLVKGITEASIHHSNVNQTRYMTIPLYEILTVSTDPTTFGSVSEGLIPTITIHQLTGAGTKIAAYGINLSRYLPQNVLVVAAIVGFLGTLNPSGIVLDNGSGGQENVFTLYLSRNATSVWTVGSPASSQADVSTMTNAGFINSSTIDGYVAANFVINAGNVGTFGTNTIYLNLDSTIPSNYIIGKSKDVRLSAEVAFSSSGPAVNITASPVLIKYRWV